MQRRSYLSIPILMVLALPVVPLIRTEKALFDPPVQSGPDPASPQPLNPQNSPTESDDGKGGAGGSPHSRWTLTRINLRFMWG
jgi:hypothetical protein